MSGVVWRGVAFVAALSMFPAVEVVAQNLTYQQGPPTVVSDPSITGVAGSGVFTTNVVDLRGNGHPDIVLGFGVFPPTARTKVPMRVLRSVNGALQDVTRQILGNGALPSMEHPREIIAGDFFHTGRTDLFIAGHGYDTSPFDGETNVLLAANGDGTYTARSSLLPTQADFSHSTTSADINGDGYKDIYVGQVYGSARVPPYFLMGQANGTFVQRTNNLPNALLLLQRKFTCSLLLDVDGDGDADLLLGTDHDGGNANSIVLRNDGTGDYTKLAEIALPQSVFGANQNVMDIATHDFNGDGRPDLLVIGTQAQPFYQGRFLQMLINNGDGTFRDETSARLLGNTSTSAGAWNRFIRFEDINGDGLDDFHINSNLTYSGETSDLLWINDGAGHFRAQSSSTLASAMADVEALDVDGDGRMDFVEATANGNGQLMVKVFTATIDTTALDSTHQYLWLVPAEVRTGQQGFIRLTNRGTSSASVAIRGLDATGRRSHGSVTLTLAPKESRQLNSTDLERGNAAKGLAGALGWGSGDWTLDVASAGDVEALAYIRTPDGFLTSMHDRVKGDGVDWAVPFFNPAENANQVSRLRIVNTNPSTTSVQITGIDDAGHAGTGTVALTLAAFQAVELSSSDLENGNPDKHLLGQLGNGAGKWRLNVAATGRITVQSLLYDPKGYLTNLSTLPDPTPVSGLRTIWYVPAASNTLQQGFIRLTNRSATGGTVTMWGVDDAGHHSPGTATFSLAAGESRQFNSQDLELGNAAKMSGSLGTGSGDWRIVLQTTLDLAAMGLIRTPDGFLTAVHDLVPGSGTTLTVPVFNPAENLNQLSVLRLVNPGTSTASVTLAAVDDAGTNAPGGNVTLTLAAGAAKELTSVDLEQGNAGLGLGGAWGDGNGKWRVTITSSQSIKALSLLRDPKGYLTDLSTAPRGGSSQLNP